MGSASSEEIQRIYAWLRKKGILVQDSPPEKPHPAPVEDDDPRRLEGQFEFSLKDTPGSRYTPEPIPPRKTQQKPPKERLPAPLRQARKLAREYRGWNRQQEVFLAQAQLLADYTDDYENLTGVVRYFPTYQDLSDRELRSYFSWRTKLRRGVWEKTSLSFAFLYTYELLNQVGVTDPMDGYRKLITLRDSYGQIDSGILSYLEKWLFQYVPYYRLDASLLADTQQVKWDSSALVLMEAGQHTAPEILDAVLALSPQWLEQSAFFREHREDMGLVLAGVLRGMAAHYSGGSTRGLLPNLFGGPHRYPSPPFEFAVFLRRDEGDWTYQVDPLCQFRSYDGCVTVERYNYRPAKNKEKNKLAELTKSVDAALRQATRYGHPIQVPTQPKWIDKLIEQEIQALLADKAAAEAKANAAAAVPKLDLSSLARIRRDADLTRDRLMVEEEQAEEAPAQAEVPAPVEVSAPSETSAPAEDGLPLAPEEYRLLRCLLYGLDRGWAREAGLLPSVLADSINEKLYDQFMDIVIADDLTVVEDYREELKGRIPL